MENKNQEQATVVNNEQQPVENKKSGFWNKAKKFGIAVLKVAVPVVAGFAAGAVASKYGYVNKEQHSLAEAQKTYLNRKNGNV